MDFIFRPLWLAVPDAVYFVLLVGGVLALLLSIGMFLYGMVRKRTDFSYKWWIMLLLIAAALIFLTITGKIAPYGAFGG